MSNQGVQLNEKEIKHAMELWYQKYPCKKFDREITSFLSTDMRPFSINEKSWLRNSREALFLSAKAVADRLGSTRASYIGFEKREQSGKISLASLAKAAEALDCELVYAIRPKQIQQGRRIYFSTRVWDQLFEAVHQHGWLGKCDQRRRSWALLGLVARKTEDPKFRKERGWNPLLHWK